MPIYESSKDYGTGQVLILWDGDKPSNEEFLEHAINEYGVTGALVVEEPTLFRGMENPGTATITPNVQSDRLACGSLGGGWRSARGDLCNVATSQDAKTS